MNEYLCIYIRRSTGCSNTWDMFSGSSNQIGSLVLELLGARRHETTGPLGSGIVAAGPGVITRESRTAFQVRPNQGTCSECSNMFRVFEHPDRSSI